MSKLTLSHVVWNQPLNYNTISTLIPQALSQISQWPLVLVDGVVQPEHTKEGWVSSPEGLIWPQPLDRFSLANIMNWLSHPVRGEILKPHTKQTDPSNLRYSAPVPLVMSAFLEYRSIPYDRWNWDDTHISSFCDQHNLECYQWHRANPNHPWTSQELEAFREQALVVKTGRKSGTRRSPVSCAVVYNQEDPHFKSLPRFVKLELLGLWCWSVGHPYFIHGGTVAPVLSQPQTTQGGVW